MNQQTEQPSHAGEAKRTARLAAVQALYQMEYGQERSDGLHLEEGEHAAKPHRGLMQDIILCVQDRQVTIDEILTKSLDADWSLDRLERVLRSILRAGVAELLMNARTPVPILISDYIDVTHAFFGGKEPGLVNAVLDRAAKLLRP